VTWVFVAVVAARFLLPLLIPRQPLPAIVGCLVLDGVDQSIFQAFGYDPPGYQSYDKAMDVYYLAIAYVATLRNWASLPAFVVGRFLYFYRLVGVVAFELAQARWLLLVFPNTFEYFFIAYEAVRSRWSPLRLLLAGWVLVAAGIWVFVKLPQEWWIHIAQLDVTDTLADYPWTWAVLIGGVLALLAVWWFAVRPRLPEPDWPPRTVADLLPEEIDTAAEQARWRAEHATVWSWTTLEKVALVGLLSVVFAQLLPGVRATELEVLVGTAVLVVANTAIVLALARRALSTESLVVAFLFRVLVNVALVGVAELVLGRGDLDGSTTAFFLVLLSLLTTLHDRYLPVHVVRARGQSVRAR
jgi:hypothetical protein